jgi:hypothetical protein
MVRSSLLVCSSASTLTLARDIRFRLENEVRVSLWTSDFQVGDVTISALLTQLSSVDYALFLLGEDDIDQSRTIAPSSGLNSAFELGVAIGSLGRDRVLIGLQGGSIDLPSDLTGVTVLRLNLDDPTYPDVLAETLLDQIRSLRPRVAPVGEIAPSVFLSYSRDDDPFVQLLTRDLGKAGISCWVDAEAVRAGSDWMEELRRALSAADRALVILSDHSINSSWVQRELQQIQIRERDSRRFLLPIMLDDAVLDTRMSWLNDLRSRQILDFRDWREPYNYERALRRLIQDITIEAALTKSRST